MRSAAARCQRDALSMIAGGGADHAIDEIAVRQRREFVIGTAKFEREDRLQVLAL